MSVDTVTISSGDKTVTLTGEQFHRAANSIRLQPPLDDDFGELATLPDPRIDELAASLIERHSAKFGHLVSLKVDYRWKRMGGKSKGAGVFGKTQKPSGLLRDYAEGADFIIWLAADHCRDAEFTQQQYEALLFHELCHTGTDDDGNPTTYPHDFEGFNAELQVYGPWSAELVQLDRTIRQLKLFER